jgi:hypothetical protein
MIRTKPPSKDYDEGWDRIFGKKDIELETHVHEVGSCSWCDKGGYERLTEEEECEVIASAPLQIAPARMPRGWTPKAG